MKEERRISIQVSPQLYETLRRTASYNNCSIAKLAKIAIFAYFTDYVPEASEKVHQKCITNASQEKRNDEKERSKGKEVKKKEPLPPTGACAHEARFCSLADCREYAAEISLDADEAQRFFDHYEANGWLIDCKTPMKDWKAALRSWKSKISRFARRGELKEKAKESAEKQKKIAFAAQRRETAKKREAWSLCEERCVYWQNEPGHYCSKGAKWPPSLNDRPIPPEECSRFEPLAEGGDVS